MCICCTLRLAAHVCLHLTMCIIAGLPSAFLGAPSRTSQCCLVCVPLCVCLLLTVYVFFVCVSVCLDACAACSALTLRFFSEYDGGGVELEASSVKLQLEAEVGVDLPTLLLYVLHRCLPLEALETDVRVTPQ